MTDPVAQYKELLDTAHRAAHRYSEHERRRAVDLVDEISKADKRLREAMKTETQITDEINGWWRKVANTVSGLNWLIAGPRPTPDTRARPEALREYLAQIEPSTRAFNTAVRKTSWRKRAL
ncbi:hypothetical protein [Actinokineospora sp. NBRC 105648]|uniref:hypothetical protein n=1 Tax=Actinokineospora sp. NBRC 105648 TaxID=3032206 RepID=UPI0024A31C8B|nr:hypothetical protein [Actinokineospora sp. NBRC 105648]GLZ41907.1 hypothetical protein Acsp05_55310 [Actinokineospora sp. NBRC 105648]